MNKAERERRKRREARRMLLAELSPHGATLAALHHFNVQDDDLIRMFQRMEHRYLKSLGFDSRQIAEWTGASQSTVARDARVVIKDESELLDAPDRKIVPYLLSSEGLSRDDLNGIATHILTRPVTKSYTKPDPVETFPEYTDDQLIQLIFDYLGDIELPPR